MRSAPLKYDDGIGQAAEDRKHHVREAARLRSLAETVTTAAVRARVLAQAEEHAKRAATA